MNRKFLLVMVILSIIVGAFYAYLGGFSSAKVSEVDSQQLFVAGRAFKGAVTDNLINDSFRRAAEVLDKKELEGMLGNIYYNNPEDRGDSIHAFIGVVIPDSAVQLPADYELRVVPAGRRALRSEVNAHYMLAPNKLYEAIFDYAKEKNLGLETFYVEWFPEDHQGIVEVPIKE
ncbi:GyrI-like domain-containing protein [Pontibacter sp. JH31]|uniref:GyrI-like domain-containing protein n=1 Tax=Pontibacter aquaedesilientis TaxID=2766980 RepID=A0ABR7XL37_9BACT|nr:GyrI-like domain-containing protein [Pontibacter aquaedesilientis]MBD1398963.1 GyrI-like domain-containing protein [Pontibacter aquaedesilientis]